MIFALGSKVVRASVLSVLLLGAFALGFVVCAISRSSSSPADMQNQLSTPGNAPAEVRAGVLDCMKALQDGYTKRDPGLADAFMSRVFSQDGDLLVLGTEGSASEWVRGYDAAREFVTADWRDWGTVRMDVEHSLVWSSQDTAWVATIGTVQFEHHQRPLRITGVLTRGNERWVLRQLQFQWADRPLDPGDVIRPRTYLHTAKQLVRSGQR